ncbi:glycosyltransferase family 87 protein [Halorussus amylolyticus]|uniref:glycosyltransferase family 87 protein n=1 Tax=Halorussus amylolyticus TaxID=1126242 RepID=UPI00104BF9C1|nr:glycosyltransferase family 87 protein [Halorussus amylolyticus]
MPTSDPDSPRSPPSPWPARLVLVAGILLGILGAEATLTRRASLIGVDLKVYYLAAETALAGGDFYAASPDGHPYSYVYPPITLPRFYPYALLDSWQAAFAVHTAFNVVCALGVAVLLVKFTERYREDSLPWLDRVLVAGFVVLSLHSMPSMLYGETNFSLLLCIVAGFWWLDADSAESASSEAQGETGSEARDETGSEARRASLPVSRETLAGIAFAIPAVVKLFPAAVGLWLLRAKAWRTIAAATATGVGAFAVGFAAFGVETHLTYVRAAVVPRLSGEEFVGGLDPATQMVTLRRPISVLFPSLPESAYGVLAFALLVPVVAYTFRRIETPIERLVAIFVTMTAMVVGFPSLLLYFVFVFFPMIPLLYLLDSGPARKLFVAGAFVANFALTAANVETLVTETPVPHASLAVLDPLLALATPPLYGTMLMLAGCVLAVRRTAPTPTAPS